MQPWSSYKTYFKSFLKNLSDPKPLSNTAYIWRITETYLYLNIMNYTVNLQIWFFKWTYKSKQLYHNSIIILSRNSLSLSFLLLYC